MDTPLVGDDVYESSTNVPPASNPVVGDSDSDAIDDFEELMGFDIGLSIRDGGLNDVADTVANGDDIQKAFLDNPVKPGGIIILPGPNGTLESTPGFDDVLVAAVSVEADPLRRDTDADLVPDGLEVEQGGDPTDPYPFPGPVQSGRCRRAAG